MTFLRDLFHINGAPSGPPVLPQADYAVPVLPAEADLRWARRESAAIVRRARALDIDVDIEQAVR